MPVKDVESAIQHGKKVIFSHSLCISRNEASTRYTIIDPIIRSLGWEIHNPEQCEVEYQRGQQGIADYVLFNRDGQIVILIEAKRLDRDPVVGEEQLSGYARGRRDGVAIVTNGSLWHLYDLSKRGLFSSKFAESADIWGGSPQQAARTLNKWLRKSKWW